MKKNKKNQSVFCRICFYTADFPQGILDYLRGKGHEEKVSNSYAVVQGIVVAKGHVTAHADSRKQGKAVIVGG